ncbi:tetratricopeptide repeat protein [Paracoccus fistulariae]|uniref:Tetratricopeptide repeat protein n=1 Tax=Paracoccus fistulariae TaxID=658446 RepID=A0ABY7SP86_9RHOB|nr:tetratricopeptide repeat protein [Paracoccus fistulariae]MDB6182315.1 tetratricopeptide repeat protein [Paracoccus fistulariae]WCR08704.1 tetratricopeptide repeat protein [Paracoccus fistulariae]
MANQNDSFIDEVFDDLRRERLFRLYRRWGWLALLIVLLIVGGVIWREYSQARDETRARDWGDAVLAAEETGDPAAIMQIDPDGSEGRRIVGALLAAGDWAEAGGKDAAIEALRAVANDPESDTALQDLAKLKLVILQGAAMEPTERDEILARLSRAGAPFELLALEQKAIALIDAGRKDDAISLIRQIQQKDGLSQALRRRLSEMMIALGEEPEMTESASAG